MFVKKECPACHGRQTFEGADGSIQICQCCGGSGKVIEQEIKEKTDVEQTRG